MSRKSKQRRRAHHAQAATPDGFEFLDDRADRTPLAPLPASPLPETAEPAPALRSPKMQLPLRVRRADRKVTPEVTSEGIPVAVAETAASAAEGKSVTPRVAVATTVAIDLEGSSEAPAGDERAAAAVAKSGESKQPVAVAVAVEPPKPPQPTIGELLVRAREARHLSLEAASARTRINVLLLQHMENDQFDAFPAAAYARGSLRAYGGFLGLDVAMLVQRYREVHAPVVAPVAAARTEEARAEAKPKRVARAPRPVSDGVAPRRNLRPVWMTLGGLALLAVGYGVYTVVGRGPHDSRARGGLNEIEDELRRNSTHAQSTPTATPAPTTPESQAAPGATSTVVTPPNEDTTSPTPNGTAVGSAPVSSLQRPLVQDDASAPLTDMVPVPVPGQNGVTSSTPNSPSIVPAGALILQARAIGPCAIRVQIDADAAGAVVHRFQAGESMSWMAQQSFRLTARRGARANLQLTLNGKPITTPYDGKSIRLGTTVAEPPAPAPRRRRSTTTRRTTRSTPARSAPTPASRPQPESGLEPHGGQPPPR